jgi:hypothetical protein
MFCVYACQSPVKVPCPLRWNALERTESEMVRLCGVCDRRVYLCTSEEDMHEHVAAGRCVAVWVHEPDGDARLMLGEPAPPYEL